MLIQKHTVTQNHLHIQKENKLINIFHLKKKFNKQLSYENRLLLKHFNTHNDEKIKLINKFNRYFYHPAYRIILWGYLSSGKLSKKSKNIINNFILRKEEINKKKNYLIKFEKNKLDFEENENLKIEKLFKDLEYIVGNEKFLRLFTIARLFKYYIVCSKKSETDKLKSLLDGCSLAIIHKSRNKKKILFQLLSYSLANIIKITLQDGKISLKGIYGLSFFKNEILNYDELCKELFFKILNLIYLDKNRLDLTKKENNKITNSIIQLNCLNHENFKKINHIFNKNLPNIFSDYINEITKFNFNENNNFIIPPSISNVDNYDIYLAYKRCKNSRILISINDFKKNFNKWIYKLNYTLSDKFTYLEPGIDAIFDKPNNKKNENKKYVNLYICKNNSFKSNIHFLDNRNEIGEYLNYPNCCIRYFKNNWKKALDEFNGDLFAYMIANNYDFGSSVKINYFCNSGLFYFNSGFCTHFTCRINCRHTIIKNKYYSKIIKKDSPILFSKLNKLKNSKIILTREHKWFCLNQEKNHINLLSSNKNEKDILNNYNIVDLFNSYNIPNDIIRLENSLFL